MQVTAIIAAGGRGTRFGGADPKQLLQINGRAILDRSVSAFLLHPDVSDVVVALPSELVDDPPEYLRGQPVRLVAGGSRRQDSVANAFGAASSQSDVVVIHDAARPFVSADLITRTIAAAAESGAAIAALQARDTVKRCAEHPAEVGHDIHIRTVMETLPRERIFLAQTPQAFRRDVLAAAIAAGLQSPRDATDEAALAERAGHAVRIVDGDIWNIKVTTADDLPMAAAIAASVDRSTESVVLPARKPARTGRAGTGYDLHRLVPGRALVVGGVTIASDVGAVGHSDADVACHAVTDAILGAAGLGNIGEHFPDSDPQWQGASSLELLQRAVAIVAAEGYEVGNIDVTVILERPKIRDHVEAMRRAIGGAIGLDPSRVSIKGKTNEGVDAVGRGEAIAAHAVALIRARR
jgi:2-C-methyl-D-erythritol 4-phosphate cytidylyltransferase/2-C-methyl-D-erythritol 2,4-cyclodiphosphate synthase